MLPSTSPAPEVKERRSRRSHKNSKDGCPNCRSNRVKCSEHLPSCMQCVKKGYRCGYLDFPKERLEHIRKKNEKLQSQAAEPPVDAEKRTVSRPQLAGNTRTSSTSGPAKMPPSSSLPLQSSMQSRRMSQIGDQRIQSSSFPTVLPVPSRPIPQPHPALMQHSPRIDHMPYSHSGRLLQSPPAMSQELSARSPYLSRYNSPIPPLQTVPLSHMAREVPHHVQQVPMYASPYLVDMTYQQAAYAHPSQQYVIQAPAATQLYASPPPMVVSPSLLPYDDFSRQRVPVSSVIPRCLGAAQARDGVKSQPRPDPASLFGEGPGRRKLPPPSPQLPGLHRDSGVSAHVSTQPKQENSVPSVSSSAAPETPQISFKVEDYSKAGSNVENENSNGLGATSQFVGNMENANAYEQTHLSGNHNGNGNANESSSSHEHFQDHAEVADAGDQPSDHTHHRRKRIRIRENESSERKKAAVFSTNFRSVVYSNVLREMTQDLELIEKDVPPEYRPWEEDVPCGFNILDPKNPFFSNEFACMPETSPDTARSSLAVTSASFDTSHSRSTSMSHSIAPTPASPPKGHCLPNCVDKLTKFKVLKIPQHFQSNLFEETVKDLKQNGAHIQYHTRVKSSFMRPVYSDREFNMLWVEIFLRATVYELFFIYFIDKSINILVRASEKIVDGDIVYSPPSETSSVSSGSSFSHSGRRPHHFFYNSDDLKILSNKSYATYGRVIRELRNSINLYSPEFPARMSLFSAWACYTNPQPGFNTFMLMVKGTLVLFRNSLNESISEKTTFKMHQEFSVMESFARQSLYPDYNFKVVLSLIKEFENYKSFVDKLIELQEDGCIADRGVSRVISDPIFRHDFHELNKMIKKLLHSFYPQVSAHNRHFKTLNNLEDDNNLYFVSPSLFFEFLYDWFYMCPDEKMYSSSKTNPLKKVVYMFYHALAKSLSHCFTPMKSVSLADACNVTCTKVGFKISKPDLLDHETYRALRPILRNLTRTIRFFETRSKLLAYRIIKESVLDDEFIKPTEADPNLTYKDIVQILPAKIKVRERQIENISQTIFAAHNFPFPEELYANPMTADMIHSETERQHTALQKEPYEFDYSVGLANHDFHPDKIVDVFVSQKKDELNQSNAIANEKLNVRIENLLKSRDVISNSVRRESGSPG